MINMLLAITSDTWIVTGLGFGIVLMLLFCLVFILQFFGFVMQKMTNGASKPTKPSKPSTPSMPSAPSEAKEEKSNDDTAAIAMALYLASLDVKHDVPTPMINLKARETVWNTKTIGLN